MLHLNQVLALNVVRIWKVSRRKASVSLTILSGSNREEAEEEAE